MPKTIPIFKFHIKSTATDYFGRIELKKDVVCRISDFAELYKYLGYGTDLAKTGILPEEYIWETFFKHSDRNCISCYQLHLIEYLLKHSDTFTKKFMHQCDDLVEVHAKARSACKVNGCADRKEK